MQPGARLPVATALIAAALLLAPALSHAGASASVSIDGATDSDVQFVTATAEAIAPGPGVVGAATADADLASGTLRATTDGSTTAVIGNLLDATAAAELADVLYLTPGPGSPTTPVPFTLFMDVDGILLVDGVGLASPNLQLAAARTTATLSISGFAVTGVSPASITATRRVQAAAGVVVADDTTVDSQQNTTGTAADGLVGVRLTATAMVTPGSGIDVGAVLAAESHAEAGFSAVADLSQTARLGVVVPAGYSLSSSSGVFLTVPEPGAVASCAGTAVALLAIARRRRRSA